MITIQYTAKEDVNSHLVTEIVDKYWKDSYIKNLSANISIFNYASFFGKGLNLLDPTIQLGTPDDYYGLIVNQVDSSKGIKIYNDEPVDTYIYKLSVIFYKYSCGTINVYLNGLESQLVYSMSVSEGQLPLSTSIPLNIILGKDDYLTIKFDDINKCSPPCIKGIMFGNIFEINNIIDYNSIFEINPISDDLALNETNLTASISTEFKYDRGQTIKYYDDGALESDSLVELTSEGKSVYSLKSQNILEKLSQPIGELLKTITTKGDTYEDSVYLLKDVINAIWDVYRIKVIVPDENVRFDPFLLNLNGRQFLQQIAWITSCAVDTTYTDGIKLIPIFNNLTDEITITNEDDRILETKVSHGDIISRVVIESTEYAQTDNLTNIGEMSTITLPDGTHQAILSTDNPFAFKSILDSNDLEITDYKREFYLSPYYFVFDMKNPGTYKVKGYSYNTYKKTQSLITDLKNWKGKVLTISNQTLYNKTKDNAEVDLTTKLNQIAKWYTDNNTLEATIADDTNQLRLGQLVNIQLEDTTFFKGIITKIERSNISDYHTVKIEVHQWN